MSTVPRKLVALLAALVLVGACGSATPTPSPTASTGPAPTSTATPSATPASVASPTPSADPFVGTVAVTVSDRLRVRSQPRVSDDSIKYEPVLPLGTKLQVVGGPVEASGYTWYEVEPVSLTLAGGAQRGWVAMADHDGTPWIALAEPPITGLEVATSSVERATANPADAKTAATAIDTFGLELYRRILADPDTGTNVVFSPTSIALALGLARAGAKGETASQMDDLLHMDGWDAIGPGLNALDQALASRDGTYTDDEGGTHELALRIANTTFAQRGWSIEPAYLDAIARAFGAGLHLVDYIADHEAARKTINAWVSRQTEGRIPELLDANKVRTTTRLYLVNAMYLKANWIKPFDVDATTLRAFVRSDGTKIKVPTMELGGEQEVPLVRGDGWKATELRYRGPDGMPLAMTLVMPDKLASFEQHLTAKQLVSITTAVTKERQRLTDDVTIGSALEDCGSYPYSLRLFMPKFSTDSKTDLVKALTDLGMRDAFDAGLADLTGIHAPDAEGPIFISAVIHQANIDVDEKGTTAAAATAIGVDTGGCTGPLAAKTITLRLDHPFLYLLRDLETGAILFMGRVADPSITP